MKTRNKLTKLIALLLVFMMAVLTLASCQGESTPGKSAYELAVEQGFEGTLDEWLASLKGDAGEKGENGKSAYELAVEQGFVGTLDEWLDSITGNGGSGGNGGAGNNGGNNPEDAAKLEELLTTKHKLSLDENGDFKILFLSDVQNTGPNINAATKNHIKTLVDREDPDLVLFLGDNHYTGVVTVSQFRNYVTEMVSYIESKQIPWAQIYGNHDSETTRSDALPKETQQEIYEEFEYNVSKAGDEDIFGVGNYVIPVWNHEGTKLAFAIYGLDTGSYRSPAIANIVKQGEWTNTFMGGYEGMQVNQVEWYAETSALLKEFNGATVPSMMYFHIPLQEMYTAWSQRDMLELEYDGERRENIAAPAFNAGLFDKIQELKDVQLIANGHDHVNDFSVKYKGVRMCYSSSVGTEAYYANDLLGGRVVTYTGNAADAFETYMSYITERPKGNELVNLGIDKDNGTVSNIAKDGPVISEIKTNNSSKAYEVDSVLHRPIVILTPNSTYGQKTGGFVVPTKNVNDTLKNGFSFDTYFKLDNLDVLGTDSNACVGILDYVADGGFGLYAYKNTTDATKATLCLKFAYGNKQWKEIKFDVSLDKWTHCAFSYSGTEKDTIVFYVNGVLVKIETLSGDMVLPTFTGVDPFMAIGGVVNATDSIRNGMAGSFATCNVYAVPCTQAHVTAMYSEINVESPIFQLEINSQNNTVSNGIAGGPTLIDHKGAVGTKTTKTDSETGLDMIQFDSAEIGKSSEAYYFNTTPELEANLANGFAYEIVLKPTEGVTSGYTGALDYEERGGFGLNVYPGSDSQHVILLAEIAVKNGNGYAWKQIRYEVPINEWYHCVYVYNGTDSGRFYVNGQEVGYVALNTEMTMPVFTNNTTPHIVIGASAGSGPLCTSGFEGCISICNIFSTPMDEEGVRALYEAYLEQVENAG